MIEEMSTDEIMENMNTNISQQIQREKNIELLERLTNKIKARSLWKKYGYNELLQIRETLSEAIEKAELEHLEQQELEEKRQEARQQVENLLADMGLSLEEITQERKIPRPIKDRKTYQPRGSSPLTYKVREFGRDWFWNGKNLCPTVFRYSQQKNGTKKRDCRMPQDEWFVSSDPVVRDTKIPEEHRPEVERILGAVDWDKAR